MRRCFKYISKKLTQQSLVTNDIIQLLYKVFVYYSVRPSILATKYSNPVLELVSSLHIGGEDISLCFALGGSRAPRNISLARNVGQCPT